MTWYDSLDRFRRPEYTGQNRCLPCTIVNLAIIGVVGGAVAIANLFVGAFVIVVGLVVLALRGYVVPGTPRFAPRIVAPLPIDFGHADERRDTLSGPESSEDPQAVLASLVDAGVIRAEGEELFLDEDFRTAWNERIADLRTARDSEFLDRVEAACPADVEGHLQDDRVLLAGDRDVRTSRTIALAETAAIETLSEWGLPESIRAPAAPPLRNFLRTCPNCGGDVTESTLKNCCGGSGSVYKTPGQPVLACEDCESIVTKL